MEEDIGNLVKGACLCTSFPGTNQAMQGIVLAFLRIVCEGLISMVHNFHLK